MDTMNLPLEKMNEDIAAMIIRTLKTMIMTKNTEAAVSCKVKVTLNRESKTNEYGFEDVLVPYFSHEVQSVVQAKDKISGDAGGDYELVFNPDTGAWTMKKKNEQTSMFDDHSDDETDPQPLITEGAALIGD